MLTGSTLQSRALPIAVRVQQLDPASWPVATSQASTSEGLWLVSEPGGFGADDAEHPELAEYGELLLLTPDRGRILRAYPFRGVPPQWLLVTPKAVSCGRSGDGGLPDSMVCRVDRCTGALSVAVFSSPTDSGFGKPQPLAGRPGSWRLDGSHPAADLQHVPKLTVDGLLFARDPNQIRPRPESEWRRPAAAAGSGDPELTRHVPRLRSGAPSARMAPCPVCRSRTFPSTPTPSYGNGQQSRISRFRSTC